MSLSSKDNESHRLRSQLIVKAFAEAGLYFSSSGDSAPVIAPDGDGKIFGTTRLTVSGFVRQTSIGNYKH
jgi:hypothetical protein